MKKINGLIAAILMIASFSLTAQVAITTGGGSADASAMLDVQSTSKGFLPPRMTSAQMGAIASPAFGLIVMCTDCNPKGPYYYDGVTFLNFVNNVITFSDVTSVTGEIWMDRNLGATRVATSSTDAASYGYLYQWGRLTDGHQIRTSVTTTDLSSTDVPGHGNFILTSSSPNDWRSPQNDILWQGVNGTNNPCPTGYRLPTNTEWESERLSWSSNDAAGAFASPLKLTVGGYRVYAFNGITQLGIAGCYWSSSVLSTNMYRLNFTSNNANMTANARASGMSVRCIKD